MLATANAMTELLRLPLVPLLALVDLRGHVGLALSTSSLVSRSSRSASGPARPIWAARPSAALPARINSDDLAHRADE